MMKEGTLGHAGGGNHVIDRARREAAPEHQLLGSVQNGAFGLRSVLSQPSLLVAFSYRQTIWSVLERRVSQYGKQPSAEVGRGNKNAICTYCHRIFRSSAVRSRVPNKRPPAG